MGISLRDLLNLNQNPNIEAWRQFFDENPIVNLNKPQKYLDGKTPIEYLNSQESTDVNIGNKSVIIQHLISPPLISLRVRWFRLIRGIFGRINVKQSEGLKSADTLTLKEFIEKTPLEKRVSTFKKLIQDRPDAFGNFLNTMTTDEFQSFFSATEEETGQSLFHWLVLNLNDAQFNVLLSKSVKANLLFNLLKNNQGILLKEIVRFHQTPEIALNQIFKRLSSSQRMELLLLGDEKNSVFSGIIAQLKTNNASKVLQSIFRFFSKNQRKELLNDRQAAALQNLEIRSDSHEIREILYQNLHEETDIHYKKPSGAFVSLGKKAWELKSKHIDSGRPSFDRFILLKALKESQSPEKSGLSSESEGQKTDIIKIGFGYLANAQKIKHDFEKLNQYIQLGNPEGLKAFLGTLSPQKRTELFAYNEHSALGRILNSDQNKKTIFLNVLFSSITVIEKEIILKDILSSSLSFEQKKDITLEFIQQISSSQISRTLKIHDGFLRLALYKNDDSLIHVFLQNLTIDDRFNLLNKNPVTTLSMLLRTSPNRLVDFLSGFNSHQFLELFNHSDLIKLCSVDVLKMVITAMGEDGKVRLCKTLTDSEHFNQLLPILMENLRIDARRSVFNLLIQDRNAYLKNSIVSAFVSELNSLEILSVIKDNDNFVQYIKDVRNHNTDAIAIIFNHLSSEELFDYLKSGASYTESRLNDLITHIMDNNIIHIIESLSVEVRIQLIEDRNYLALKTLFEGDVYLDRSTLLKAFVQDFPESIRKELCDFIHDNNLNNQLSLGPILSKKFEPTEGQRPVLPTTQVAAKRTEQAVSQQQKRPKAVSQWRSSPVNRRDSF